MNPSGLCTRFARVPPCAPLASRPSAPRSGRHCPRLCCYATRCARILPERPSQVAIAPRSDRNKTAIELACPSQVADAPRSEQLETESLLEMVLLLLEHDEVLPEFYDGLSGLVALCARTGTFAQEP